MEFDVSVTNPLPSYENPPVIEVVIGYQFAPLPQFQATHYGLLWNVLKEQYPTVESAVPLTVNTESFGATHETQALARFEVGGLPPLPRMFFISRDPDSWVVQVQRERFLHNWRRGAGNCVYPRFPAVKDRFISAWRLFQGFCVAHDLGQPAIDQLEVTYINHMPVGQGWETVADAGEVFRDLTWNSDGRFLPPPESIAYKTTHLMPGNCGRLHIKVNHAIRKDDFRSVLLCELTARGIPANTDDESLLAWVDQAREWIVRGFADITTHRMQHAIWRRNDH